MIAAKPVVPDDIGLWVIRLDQPDSVVARALDQLTIAEAARARRYRSEAARRRFVITRAALRVLIAMAAGLDTRCLRLSTTRFGKPVIPGSDLHVSVAHSHDRALIALAWRRRVGVDLEWRAGSDPGDLWRQLGAAEAAAGAAMETEARREAFFRVWTRKEALLKAIGTGLRMPLDSFEVPTAPWERPFAPKSAAWPDEAERWRIVDVPLGGEYAAALAFEGRRSYPRSHQGRCS